MKPYVLFRPKREREKMFFNQGGKLSTFSWLSKHKSKEKKKKKKKEPKPNCALNWHFSSLFLFSQCNLLDGEAAYGNLKSISGDKYNDYVLLYN